VAPGGECLPSKHKALNSKPALPKQQQKTKTNSKPALPKQQQKTQTILCNFAHFFTRVNFFVILSSSMIVVK
jgi:hypothetical protein